MGRDIPDSISLGSSDKVTGGLMAVAVLLIGLPVLTVIGVVGFLVHGHLA